MQREGQKVSVHAPYHWQKDDAICLAKKKVLSAFRVVDAVSRDEEIVITLEEISFADEGYQIEQIIENNIRTIFVRGHSPLAVTYGLFHIRKMVKMGTLNDRSNQRIECIPDMHFRLDFIHDNPGEEQTCTAFRDARKLLEYGYNGVVYRNFPSLLLYDSLECPPYKHGSWEREWIVQQRNNMRRLIDEAHKYHLKVFLWGDVLTLPYTLKEMSVDVFHDNDRESFCVGKDDVWTIYQQGLEELFRSFPDVAGIVVRTGENYVHSDPTVMGNNPKEGNCNACHHLDPYTRDQLVIEKTKEITERYDRIYFHRTWGFDGFHQYSDHYLQVVDQIKPSPHLFFSIKHTETDFWRYNHFNPCIGKGKHPQMVEYQCQREYEGKGAFPNFTGRIFAEDAPEVPSKGGMKAAYDLGVRAVWSWSRGGGWNGPYVKDEMWINANVYAFIQLAMDTTTPIEQLSREWASLEFDVPFHSQTTEVLYDILMTSEEAVKKMFYVAAYCESLENRWAPNRMWIRDDDLTTSGLYEMAMTLIRYGKVEEAIREKEEACTLCQSMLDSFLIIKEHIPDQSKAELAETTLRYMYSLSLVIFRYFESFLLYHQWLDGIGGYDTKLGMRILQSIEKWEEYWHDYRTVIPKLTGAPSLYEDVGMGGMMQSMHDHLQHHVSLDLVGKHWGYASKDREMAIAKHKRTLK